MRGSEHQLSISQFSRQPLTPFEPRFVISDRFDTLQHRRGPKTFRGAKLSWRFRMRLSSPPLCRRAVSFRKSRQPLTPFEPRFVFPDRFNTLQHRRGPKTFRGAKLSWRFRMRLSPSLTCLHRSNSQKNRQPLIPFNFCLVILDRNISVELSYCIRILRCPI